MECTICSMWDMHRPATHRATWDNGNELLICISCFKGGAGINPVEITDEPAPAPVTEESKFEGRPCGRTGRFYATDYAPKSAGRFQIATAGGSGCWHCNSVLTKATRVLALVRPQYRIDSDGNQYVRRHIVDFHGVCEAHYTASLEQTALEESLEV